MMYFKVGESYPMGCFLDVSHQGILQKGSIHGTAPAGNPHREEEKGEKKEGRWGCFMDALTWLGSRGTLCRTWPCFGMGGGCSEPLLAAMVRKERKVGEGHVGRSSFRVRKW